jgi:hypothetical protein
MAMGALSRAGVTHSLDNAGSGEVVMFDVGIERRGKAVWYLPVAIAGTEHRLPGVRAVAQRNVVA